MGVSEEEALAVGPGVAGISSSVPVAGDESVSGVAEEELVVGDPGGEGVAVVDEPGGLAVESDFVDAVSVEVTDEGFVSGIAEQEGEFGCSQSSVVGSKGVDDVEALF